MIDRLPVCLLRLEGLAVAAGAVARVRAEVPTSFKDTHLQRI